MSAIQDGARVRLTFRERRGDRVVDAYVTWTEEREGFLYFGYQPMSVEHGLWGCAKQYPEPRPFGLQSAEVLS